METVILVDYENKLVVDTAKRITQGAETREEKLERVFLYVRDEIKFGFHEEVDYLTASEIINRGMGQCNNKTTVFLALCKVVGIPAKIHFSTIDKRIQQGLFRGIVYWMMPKEITHSWIDVELDGRVLKLDAFVNDKSYYSQAKGMLEKENLDTGYSISCSKGKSSIEFDINNENFVQMGAVKSDHGVCDEPLDYYKTDKYMNKLNFIKMFLYKMSIRTVNDRIKKIRGAMLL